MPSDTQDKTSDDKNALNLLPHTVIQNIQI